MAGDTFNTQKRIAELGHPEKMMLGDQDRATHIARSDLLRGGASLTEATAELCRIFKIKQPVIPMSDKPVSSIIEIPGGEVHFQEFWVGRGGEPDVLGVRYEGEPEPSPGFVEALEREKNVLIGPSNPITSIGPIIALDGVLEALSEKKVVAVSPFIGNEPLSGPAAKLMKAVGRKPNAAGMAEVYNNFLDVVVVHEGDGAMMEGTGVDVVETDIMIAGTDEAKRLASEVVGLF